MTHPDFKNDLELAAYAVANPGWKFTDGMHTYIFDNGWWCNGHHCVLTFNAKNDFKPYTEPKYKCDVCKDTGLRTVRENFGVHQIDCDCKPKPAPKLVTWWVPVVVWYEGDPKPKQWDGWAYQDKDEIQIKVLEWRSLEAPETYEDCE